MDSDSSNKRIIKEIKWVLVAFDSVFYLLYKSKSIKVLYRIFSCSLVVNKGTCRFIRFLVLSPGLTLVRNSVERTFFIGSLSTSLSQHLS